MSLLPPSAGFVQTLAPVIENVAVARDTYRLRIRCEGIAERIRPGQFVMVRIPSIQDPLLGRAFALYETVHEAGRPIAIDIVYLVVGKMTRQMAALKPVDTVSVWGPLGNGFPDYTGVEHLVLIAGGIGQTPFLALAKQAAGLKAYGGSAAKRQIQRVSFYYGARNEGYLADLDAFVGAGCKLHLATDDGSLGFRGFVTQLLDLETLPYEVNRQRWVGCGPEPMLHALAELARRRGARCDLSLETPMACGVGICFSCVTQVQCEGGADYRRVCVEGPVFDAAQLVW